MSPAPATCVPRDLAHAVKGRDVAGCLFAVVDVLVEGTRVDGSRVDVLAQLVN